MMTSTLHRSTKIIAKHRRDFSKRQLRGLGIVAKGAQISIGARKGLYHVISQSRDNTYKIQIQSASGKERWSCTCPDFLKRDKAKACKHIYAVLYWLKLPTIAKANGYSIGTEMNC